MQTANQIYGTFVLSNFSQQQNSHTALSQPKIIVILEVSAQK